MKQVVLIFITFLIFIEGGFQVEKIIREKSFFKASKKDSILIMGGSTLFQIRQQIENSLRKHGIKNLNFSLSALLKTSHIIEILTDLPSEDIPKYVFFMVGNDERITTSNQIARKSPVPKFPLLYYNLVNYYKKYNGNRIDYIIQDTISDLNSFYDNISNENEGLRIYFSIQEFIESKQYNNHEKDKYKTQLHKYLLQHPKYSFFKNYSPSQVLTINQELSFRYLLSFLHFLGDKEILSAKIYSTVLTNNNLSRTQIQTYITQLFSQHETCTNENDFSQSKLHPIDKIILCHISNIFKKNEKTKNGTDHMDTITFLIGYMYQLNRKVLKQTSPPISILNSIQLSAYEQIFERFLERVTDAKMINENLEKIKRILKKKGSIPIFVHYPGFNNEQIQKRLDKLGINSIKNTPKFLRLIEDNGFFTYFRDRLNYNTGHLNKAGEKIWIEDFSAAVAETLKNAPNHSQ